MSQKPYYQDNACTIYHGDCREILPTLPKVDLVLTDPPYGVELGLKNNQSRDGTHLGKRGYRNYNDTYNQFISEIVPRLNSSIDLVGRAIIFTGPHIHEQRKPVAIGGIYCSAATGRTPWGSKNLLPILFYGNPTRLAGTHRPTVFASNAICDDVEHPCPKPLEWITWLLSSYSDDAQTILDPFMGSGTTLRAAKDLGRNAIGIEIEERYCEIAAKRLAQEVLPLTA